ncbi:MAG: right-handed parallel beta-helix repeat-containing protein [Proteobacteria bacterium]|uniref:right-handed parallel beta-helix repeat-containing protein n=1 Tax=Rudaea sp. TaxID=2136325 RepID=UPI003783FCC3|nr:right-handed parallel beta-helix repeat-containing protein [Pseudomonadota bacterium]
MTTGVKRRPIPRCAGLLCVVAMAACSTMRDESRAPAVAGGNPLANDGYREFIVDGEISAGRYETIADALRAAADVRRKTPSTPIRIRIAPGDYYLDAPLLIGAELSGTARAPTEIVAFDPAKPPHLRAGRLLDVHWNPRHDGIWQAQVHGAAFDQLWLNGKAQVRARYPNYDANAGVLDGYAADALAPERIARWQDPAGAIVQALHENRWGGMQVPILGKNADGTLKFGTAVGNNRPSPPHATYRYVENVLEELDAPGEWFHDARTSTLYFMPPPGVSLDAAHIDVAGAARIFDLQGTAQAPLHHLRIAGLVLQHAGTSFLRNTEPLLRSDWVIAREGAVFIEHAEDVRIEGNEIGDSGGNAVFVSGRNRRIAVVGNHIHDMGGGGIDFVGRPEAVRSPSFRYEEFVAFDRLDFAPGPKTDDYPSDSVAEDNLIHRIGRIEKQVAGVDIDMAMNIRVTHNSIYDVPRAGINVGGGTWGGHLIEYNDVFDTVLETGDHGAFNSWGRDRFWHPDRKVMDALNAAHPDLWQLDVLAPITLRHNRFRCDHGWDIDLDDGSSNYRIYDNVLLNGGLKFREGFSREAWNNVLVNNSFHPHVWFARSGDAFERNIVMAPYRPILVEHWDARIDRNLFPTRHALDSARAAGLDAHSAYGDPKFLDPAHGDYRVREGSPARPLGFENFPMDEFGVTSAQLKAQARRPGFPELLALDTAATAQKTHSFLGATMKSVASLGEQSAAGLARIAGVLVLAAPAQSAAAKAGLAAGDVIVEALADGYGSPVEPIDTIADLLRLSTARAWRGEVEVIVIRNQRREPHVLPLGAR